MDTTPPSSSVNIPSVLLAAILSFFAIRYFFFSPSTSSSSSTPTPGSITVPADRVEQLATMFPQLSRRDIEWDLLRNGGSVQASSERILREGRLPTAPPNFRPSAPAPNTVPPTTSSSNSTTTSTASAQKQKQIHQDLIQRYNLSSRIASSSDAAGGQEAGVGGGKETPVKGKQAWSANKGDREVLLKQRREEMVLAARRKMEERQGGSGKGKERAV